MKFIIKQKILSLSDSFVIHDENKNPAYKVEGRLFSFGDKLKECRKAKNLTLEELAYKYNKRFEGGLSKGTLSKYENNKQEPLVSVVSNLTEILDVSSDYLLGRTDFRKY